ncbi:MAG TPA: DUF5681 domain-containing protein [Stellaceae bacterium]|nr:DUF5681 domain-containing protein [Stellaceae bacterium]
MPEHDNSSYTVGYGRPPRSSQFKPGKSGNPKGRPKGAKNFATVIQEELEVKIAVTENGRRRKITKRQAVAKQLVNKAAAGDAKVIPVLLNEARLHEGQPAAISTEALFGRPEDRNVIENIVKRIRNTTSPPPDGPETTAPPSAEPQEPEPE